MEDSAETAFLQLSGVSIRKIVSRALSELAKDRGLSLKQIHEQSGVGWNSVIGMAHGKDNSTLEKVEKLAKFFELSGAQFLLLGVQAVLGETAKTS